jgi:NAD(P)-dependent dehydrogenase (short-subunit alcohol dehydrogenase family)
MTGKLEGKIALVTGASSGIGLATAKAFVAEGAEVFMTGRSLPQLKLAAATIGPSAIAIRADSSQLSDLDRLFAEVRARTGRLDVIFANAGGCSRQPLGTITQEHYDEIFNSNVRGVLFTVQKALPLLPGGASIILSGSTTGSRGGPGLCVYGASKAAVRNFARSWVHDLKGRGIRVNTITPGPIHTRGLTELAGKETFQQQGLLRLLATQIPLGRIGMPEEVAQAAVFLASEDSSFVTGAELFVDGGMAQI